MCIRDRLIVGWPAKALYSSWIVKDGSPRLEFYPRIIGGTLKLETLSRPSLSLVKGFLLLQFKASFLDVYKLFTNLSNKKGCLVTRLQLVTHVRRMIRGKEHSLIKSLHASTPKPSNLRELRRDFTELRRVLIYLYFTCGLKVYKPLPDSSI